ncbi:hypothetical protein KI387_029070, partial [Taxus chinensis]
FGTSGTKVRVGRKSADLPTDSPFRMVRRYLSQAVCGTVGTRVRGGREPVDSANRGVFRLKQFGTSGPKVRGGREKPKEPPTNGISPCVFTSNRNKEARIGWFGDICP